MDVAYTQDQDDLAKLCREIFTDRFPPEQALALAQQGGPVHSPKLWSALAEAGLLGLPFDESVGGVGAGLTELAIAFREAGRAVGPDTFTGTMLAALLIDHLGSADQRQQLLPPLLDGRELATVALAEAGTDGLAWLGTTARRSPTGWTLTGSKIGVPYAELAELIVVVARDHETGQPCVFAAAADSPGVRVRRQASFGGDGAAQIELDAVDLGHGALLGSGVDPTDALQRWRDIVLVLRSMEMLGGAEAVLERTARYVGERHQFGRPIGSFQAVQHLVANVAIAVTAAEPVVLRAAWLLGENRPVTVEAAVASSWAARTFTDATVWAHQLHGGMGFARESGLYLWSERAKLLELQDGGRRRQLETIASAILDNLT